MSQAVTTARVWRSEAGRGRVLERYRRLLDRWPVPSEEMVLGTALGPTFVVAWGSKQLPALLVLHGSTSNSAVWLGAAAALAAGHRVYAIDIPGEPGLSESVRPSLSGPAYTEWLLDVCRALALDTADLLGVSMGGYIAQKFAVAHPEKVTRLGLVSPAGIAPSRASFTARCILFMLMGQPGQRALFRLVCGREALPAELVEYLHLISEHFSPRLGSIPALGDDELRRLTMPLLYIAGDADALLSTARSVSRLRRLVPHARVDVVRGVGHMVMDIAARTESFFRA